MARYASSTHIERAAKLTWVPLKAMAVNPMAQRGYKENWAEDIYENFDPEQLGYPTVNLRGGVYYICDGQHRRAALIRWLGDDWEKQSIQCQVYEGLSEKEEAEMFLKLNNNLAVSSYAKFVAAVTAGHDRENEINQIVVANGLRIAPRGEGTVSCVGTLIKIYERAGGDVLGTALRIIYVAYGDYGLSSTVIDAMGFVVERYAGIFNETEVTAKLKVRRAGINGLLTSAERLRASMGTSKAQAIAGAIVEELNKKPTRGSTTEPASLRLPKWWSYVEEDA